MKLRRMLPDKRGFPKIKSFGKEITELQWKHPELPRDEYIYTVLSSELYTKEKYIGWGLTKTQIGQLYQAQAMAANAFLEYTMRVYSKHSSEDYIVCSSSCCQKYDPSKVTETAIEATSKIFYTSGGKAKTNMILYKPTSSTYEYIWAAFFSDCDNLGTKTHSSQPALQSVACTDLRDAYDGHRYGMCQMGAAKLAKESKSSYQILYYYYTGCVGVSCVLE